MTDLLGRSQLFSPLFSSAAMRAIMDDGARIKRLLDFEAALARAEAAVGMIPASAAARIAEACDPALYDATALAQAAAEAGNIAAPLIEALAAEVRRRDDHAAGFVHWGATSQDLLDTALVIELRAAIDVLLEDLDRATRAFVTLAGKHRRTMTIARIHLQHALPMPFGLKLAGYAAALGRSRDRLRRLRREALTIQFGGTAGTLAALGERGLDVSDRLAALLDLPTADAPWHGHRDRLAEIAAAFAVLAGTCGKIAHDVAFLMQSEIGEVFVPQTARQAGAAALPLERGPAVVAAALSAALLAPNLAASILAAQSQENERAAGWQVEWLTFPALALVTSGTLNAIANIAEGLDVDVARAKANLERTGGRVLAEAVLFALAVKIGKPEAHALTSELIRTADKDNVSFREVVQTDPRVTTLLTGDEINRLFYATSYQGAAQTFIDRLVASAQGRSVHRPSPFDALLPKPQTVFLAAPDVSTAPLPSVPKMPAAPEILPPPEVRSESEPPPILDLSPDAASKPAEPPTPQVLAQPEGGLEPAPAPILAPPPVPHAPPPPKPEEPPALRMPRAVPMATVVIAETSVPQPAAPAEELQTVSTAEAPTRPSDPPEDEFAAIEAFLRSAQAFAQSGEPTKSDPPDSGTKPRARK